MKTFVLFALALVALQVNAQEMITPPYCHPVQDGVISPGEYSIATPLDITIQTNRRVKVLMGYDETAFYFAFYNNLESSNVIYPEVLIDVENEKGNTWDNNDWWFHVGAEDCFYTGQYGIFNNCQLNPPDWAAVPNIIVGNETTDTVEIKIPFSKIAYTPHIPDTLGIAFVATNNSNIHKFWPTTADTVSPSTWATLYFPPFTIGLNDKGEKGNNISVYPNPATDNLYLSAAGDDKLLSYNIYDMQARLITWGQLGVTRTAVVDVSGVQKGFYLLEVTSQKGIVRKEFVIQ
jgi:hypothetical protein